MNYEDYDIELLTKKYTKMLRAEQWDEAQEIRARIEKVMREGIPEDRSTNYDHLEGENV